MGEVLGGGLTETAGLGGRADGPVGIRSCFPMYWELNIVRSPE